MCQEAAVLVADNPEVALLIFMELLEDIRGVLYYRPKKRRQSQPRVTKSALNKWKEGRKKKIEEAKKNSEKNNMKK